REAGERLGSRLHERLPTLGDERPLVLGIARGGVFVAAEVARILGAELGVLVAQKLRSPQEPELSIGAVASDGSCFLDARALRVLAIDQAYLDAERKHQCEEARRCEGRFASGRRDLSGRTVIVVDDGAATGAT